MFAGKEVKSWNSVGQCENNKEKKEEKLEGIIHRTIIFLFGSIK